MSYSLTLTDGTPVTTLGNNIIDTTTLTVNLLGQNSSGYGLYLNENFINLLENFSSPAQPSGNPSNAKLTNPVKGQIWWDSTNRVLKVYDGTVWKEISNSTAGASAPTNNPITGDLWWDTYNGQLKTFNGATWTTIGPPTPGGGSVTTTYTGSYVADASPPYSNHVVGNIFVSNKLATVISTDPTPFTPRYAIGGLTTINPGMNFPSSIEPTMISSPNSQIGVVGGNLLLSINVGGVLTTAVSISGLDGSAQVNANPTSPLGIATKDYVDTANTTVTSYTTASNVSMKSYVDTQFNSIVNGGARFATNIIPSANLSYNLGSTTSWWNNIYGTAIHAVYADLAERFEADLPMVPGTVVELGGPNEITVAGHDLSENVFGVISTNAAYLMNSGAGTDITHPPVAVQGRVPVRVTGRIRKGDRLVSAGNGIARSGSRSEITAWNVIGRALENKTTDGEGIIEAIVKLNS